ncbi:MAG: polysaccharide biosynthesis C-terminal domain-containing protein [Candidatus Wallbacteria bacterium]
MSLPRDSFYSFILNIMLTLTNVFLSIVIIRTLGSSGRGIYSVVNSLVAIFTIALNMGLPWSNTYYTSKYKQRVPFIFVNSLYYSLLILSFAFVVLSLFHHQIQALLNKQLPEQYLTMLIFLIFAVSLTQMLNSIILGLGKVIFYNQLNFLVYFIFFIISIGLVAINEYTCQSMVAALLAAYIVVIIISSRKILKYYKIKADFKYKYLFQNIREIGLKAQFINFLGALLQRIDILIINYYFGVSLVGYYSISIFFAQLVYQIPGILGNVIFPLSTNDNLLENTLNKIIKLFHFLIFLNIILYFFLLIAGNFIITLLYGNDYTLSFRTFLVLYPGFTCSSLGIILSSFLAGRGYPSVLFKASITAIALNIILNLTLIPSLNIIGAAISCCISYFAMLLILCLHMSSNYDIKIISFFKMSSDEYIKFFEYFKSLLMSKKSMIKAGGIYEK